MECGVLILQKRRQVRNIDFRLILCKNIRDGNEQCADSERAGKPKDFEHALRKSSIAAWRQYERDRYAGSQEQKTYF